MSSTALLELLLAVALLAAAIWLYRRRTAEDRQYGSQGAVILLVIALIMGVHALGLLDYRPSPAELEARGR